MGPDQDLEYEGNMSDYTQEDRENDQREAYQREQEEAYDRLGEE